MQSDSDSDPNRGRLWVGGPSVFLGYLNLPELTAAVLKPLPGGNSDELWYDTGDIAALNQNGDLIFVGRKVRRKKRKKKNQRKKGGKLFGRIGSQNLRKVSAKPETMKRNKTRTSGKKQTKRKQFKKRKKKKPKRKKKPKTKNKERLN